MWGGQRWKCLSCLRRRESIGWVMDAGGRRTRAALWVRWEGRWGGGIGGGDVGGDGFG